MNCRVRVYLMLVSGLFLAVLYAAASQLTENQKKEMKIKEWIGQMKGQLEIDSEKFPSLIEELEKELTTVSDPATQAVLHSMLAEMYQSYYLQNSWRINQRTPVVGFIPEDMREWTSNLFTQKITEHIHASLQPADILQKTPARRFREILKEGKDSPELRPTLYDFLIGRALDIQPTDELYEKLIAFRKTQPGKEALMFAELEWVKYKYQGTEEYAARLDELLKTYEAYPFSVEIVAARLDQLNLYRYYTTQEDSVLVIAYQLATETIRKYPDYPRIGLIRSKLNQIENPDFRVEIPASVVPGKEFRVNLDYRNTQQVEVSVYKTTLSPKDIFAGTYRSKKEPVGRGEQVWVSAFPLTIKSSYQREKKEITLPALDPGFYEMVVRVPGEEMEIRKVINVTPVTSVYRTIPNGPVDVYVTDLQSGKPLSGVSVRYYEGKRNTIEVAGEVKTGTDGIARLPMKKEISGFDIMTSGDGSFITGIYTSYYNMAGSETQARVSLMTDRNLYRPGQTLFFKGIAFNQDKENVTVLTGRTYTVSLYDANNQEVATRTLTTNDFGSFHGEFTIPVQGLPGGYSIRTEGGSTYLQVEEYKRPSFQVNLLPVTGEVAYGDVVTLSGKAETFSGIPVYDGELSYRVTKYNLLPRSYGMGNTNNQVAAGSVDLQPDGTFRIQIPTGEKEKGETDRGYYRYQVVVMVTDSKGETQEGNGSFAVGKMSFTLSAEGIYPKMDKEQVAIKVQASTLNAEPVTTEGTFIIYPLTKGNGEELQEEKAITSGRFRTGEILSSSIFRNLPSGQYRIRFEALDASGRKVEMHSDFILYGKSDKRPPVFTPLWMISQKNAYLPGETVDVQIGTSFTDAWILYEVSDGKTVVNREILRLNNEIRTLRIPFLAAYRDGLLISFTMIKEGELYRESVSALRKYPDRTLTFRPEVFRDRLRPGQPEDWRFRITGPDSLAVHAEVLALMYDMSLDRIYPSGISFYLPGEPYVNIFSFEASEGLRKSMESASKPYQNQTIPEWAFDVLDWQGGLYPLQTRQSYGGIMMKSAAPRSVGVIEEMAMGDTNDRAPIAVQTESLAEGIRSNFNETAFFYPSLKTDKEGNVHVAFTVPESNTTWKMQLFAHTPEMKYGIYTNQVITQKPLMVIPNLPRFVRKGDVVSFATQVANQTGEEVSGNVSIELFDPVSGNPVGNQPGTNQQVFLLTANETGVFNWEWSVPYTGELIGVRIIATSAQGSDGEQHLLPIVTDEILLTESQPFYMTGKGNKSIEAKPGIFMPGARPYSLTFEMVSNPVWYAVQALPGLVNPESENVVDWFNAYYSNVVARSLLLTTPQLERVIRVWKEQGGTAETLYSQLEKNNELKQILLSETPWVMDAKNETEQKQRLALLFDLNRAASQKELALQKLYDQQQESGAWGWFKGNYPDRRITLYIMQGMAQLVQLNAIEYNQQEREMQIKALQYLDKTLLDEYTQLQKNGKEMKNYLPSSLQIAYLFMRSNYRDIPEGEAREAVRYFTGQAEKNWQKLGLKEKAEIAILMNRNGNRKIAGQITDWFRKTATVSEDMGMYWANNRRGADYFGSPVETHVMIMDMFTEVAPVELETDRMKQWLLLQKRTQRWTTTPATVDAVYILLKSGSDWLEESNTVVVNWGDRSFSSRDGEAITGYLKETVPGEKVNSRFEKAEVQNEGNNPVWGALYSQYFIPLDQVVADKGELSIDKKLFIETNSGEERQIIPVTEERPLRVGDKVVVRLTIRSTQEMNYIWLNDLRPGFIEPSGQLSGLQYRDGIFFYRSPKDLSENFYIDRLPAGTFVLEYEGYVSRPGEYSGGLSTIQCLYAPEFVSHTQGNRIIVRK